MNQILAIMKRPHQQVLAPDRGALCSLAAHADVEKIRANQGTAERMAQSVKRN